MCPSLLLALERGGTLRSDDPDEDLWILVGGGRGGDGGGGGGGVEELHFWASVRGGRECGGAVLPDLEE